MSNISLKFSPDANTVLDCKKAAGLLRDLVQSRKFLQKCADDDSCNFSQDDLADRFLEGFDAFVYNVEVK